MRHNYLHCSDKDSCVRFWLQRQQYLRWHVVLMYGGGVTANIATAKVIAMVLLMFIIFHLSIMKLLLPN